MEFELKDTPEMAAFRGEVRSCLQEIIPKDLMITPYPLSEEQLEARREVAGRLGARGWLFPTSPQEYGGGGLTMDHAIVIAEEVDERQLSIPSGALTVAAIMVWGTEEQKRHFLPPLMKGKDITWLLISEPHGGSDVASTKTTAVREGDEYVINGTKTFIGDDYKPDHLWTIALTDPQGPRHQNLSWFMVPAGLPGITMHPLDLMTASTTGGDDEGTKWTVFFEDVRAPAFNLIGGENNGWRVANTTLELEHGGSGSVGKERQIERFLDYCMNTAFGGEAIAKDPDVREAMAEVRINSEVHRLFSLRNFWIRHTKKAGTYEGPQSLYWRRISDLHNARAIQEAIGYPAIISHTEWAAAGGWMEVYMRLGPRGLHGQGTADIDKVIIARRMGIGRTAREEAGRVD